MSAANAIKIVSVGLALLVGTTDARAQGSQMLPGNIRAVKVEGNVWQVRSDSQRERVNKGDFLRQSSTIETDNNGTVILLFDNGSTMNLRPNSKFSIGEFLREPFEIEKVDYKSIEREPSRSVTKVKVESGTIFFDIPKLEKNSVCNIANPVGTAGIRGTAGFVADNSMGVTEGLVQVQTMTGETQSLGAGQNTGFTAQGNFSPAPSNTADNMQGATRNSQSVQQYVEPNAFGGANQSQANGQGQLTAEQNEKIESAAKQGEEALIEAVEQIASENPEAAPAAAAAAANLIPEAAPQIAQAAAAAVPQSQTASLAPQIAEAVAAVATDVAPQVAAAVASVAQNVAPQIAAAVAQTVTNSATDVAAAVAQVLPSSAAEVAGAVAAAVPSQATSIAQSVAQAVPSQADAVAQAVTTAAPNADAAAIANAAQEGSQQGNQSSNQSGGGGGGGGTPPALPGGFGGGGGGGGGSTGGGSIYSR